MLRTGPRLLSVAVLLSAVLARPAVAVRLETGRTVELGRLPTSLTPLPDGSVAVALSGEKAILILAGDTLETLRRIDLSESHGVNALVAVGEDELLVAHGAGDSVSFVSWRDGTVRATAEVGLQPGLAAVTTGKKGLKVHVPGHLSHDLAEVSVRHGVLVERIRVGRNPTVAIASPDERFVFVACGASRKIDQVDLKYDVVLGSFGVPLIESTPLLINQAGTILYAIGEKNRILKIGTERGRHSKMKVGKDPSALALSDDDRTLFVGLDEGRGIDVLNLVTGKVGQQLRGGTPVDVLMRQGDRLLALSRSEGVLTAHVIVGAGS
ncbi:MAG: hypothetical protein AAF533_17915 [Acidobacteriota bacterium]